MNKKISIQEHLLVYGLKVITYEEKEGKREFQNIEIWNGNEQLIHLEKCIKVNGKDFNGECLG